MPTCDCCSAPRVSVSSSTNGIVSQDRNGGRIPGTVSSSSMNARQQQQFPASGRRSAPLFEDPVRDVEREASRVLIEEEAHASEQRQLRLPTTRSEPPPAPGRSQSTTSFGVMRPPIRGEHPPFMAEMESRLGSKRAQPTEVAENGLARPTTSSRGIETLIDDVSDQVQRLNTTPLTPVDEVPKSAMKSAERSPSPLKPPQQANRRESSSPDEKTKKRVRFADEPKENGHFEAVASPSASTNVHADRSELEAEESNEPRVQIVGTQEIYNDPRQRRLNEIQAKSLKPVVDGASLGFRDKMKMLAEQLGEQAPKNRFKASSAERDIDT